MPLELPRRSFITGLISLVAAPAIVRVANIMPVRSFTLPDFRDRVPGLVFTCPYCGQLRGGMCPTCWGNAMMPGLMDMRASPSRFYEALNQVLVDRRDPSRNS
jgi:hypothetical protein